MADIKKSCESIDYRREDGDPEEMYIGVDKAKQGVDFSAITVRVEVDVSEAITGLKALQREAKEATKALRELENAKNGGHTHITINATDVTDFNDVAALMESLSKSKRNH